MQNRLGFVGAGNMAEAIARGVLSAKLCRPAEMIAADVSPQRRDLFADQLKIRCVEDAQGIITQCQTVMLCVKPQHMAEMLASVRDLVTEEQLLVSIAAGISTKFVLETLNRGMKLRVVRAMPNTPMLVNKGMVAICPGAHATPADMAEAKRIFAAAASVVEVREELMNAVTAVSGSGPAYFFYLVEQMIRAGVEMGLTPQQAHQLATQTARGAAEMLCTSTDSPEELRRKVTSPGGTTHAAITTMQERGMPAIVVDALKAACKRGAELGK